MPARLHYQGNVTFYGNFGILCRLLADNLGKHLLSMVNLLLMIFLRQNYIEMPNVNKVTILLQI